MASSRRTPEFQAARLPGLSRLRADVQKMSADEGHGLGMGQIRSDSPGFVLESKR